jgi:hypothetical protein
VTLVGAWLRLFVIAVFADALVVHVRTPSRLEATIRQTGLGRPPVVAAAVAAAEVTVIAALVLAPTIGFIFAVAYVLAVTFVLVQARARGREITDCGCGRETKAPDASFVLRNVMLTVGIASAALLPQPAPTDPAAWLALAAVVMHKGMEYAVPRLAHRHGTPG